MAERLIATADVVVENLAHGTMEGFGLGAATCSAANPALIYCSMPGFASDDPRAGVPGWEGVVAAAAGLYLPSTWDRSPDPRYWDTHFECADGRFVNLSWLEGRQLRAFAEMVGLAEELERDGLLDESKLWSSGFPTDELRRRLVPVFKTRSASEWARSANPAADLSNCLTTQEWLHTEEHARTSGAVVSLIDPEYGQTLQAGVAFTMSKAPPQADRPRHTLDADRSAILAELSSLRGKEVSGQKPAVLPLAGMRVVDATQILAGPTCGRILAEYGAEVIKINAPVGHPVTGHASLNSGKRTILLDVMAPAGLDVFNRLIATSDVFLMNFAPQTAERLRVTEDDVRQHRADIIYTCVSCYGWDGPRGTHRGHDLGTGNLAALATLLAVYHRLRTGAGQFVSASLAHTATFHQIPLMIDYDGRNWDDDPAGQRCRGLGPLYRLYRASDRWFFLAARATDALAAVEGLGGVDCLNEDQLSARFAGAPAATWVERLQAAGVAAHVSCTPAEAMESAGPLVERREMPDLGPVLVAGPSGRFSVTPPLRTAMPRPPGGDNAEVLNELGLRAAYEKLLATGVMATEVTSTVARPGR